MFCTKCGKEVQEGAKFCTACGNPVPADLNQQNLNKQNTVQQQTVHQQNTGNQQNTGDQQNMQQLVSQGAPQYSGYAQPPKKGGKGPIIAIIIVAVLLVVGLIVFFVLRGMNGQGGQGPAPSQSTSGQSTSGQNSPTGSNAVSASDTLNKLRDYFRNNLAASYPEADKDYIMDYGGEFGEFRSTDTKGGTVSATYADIDNDGNPEMLVVFWNFDRSNGGGETSVGVFKVEGNLVKRIDNNEITSVTYGGTDYVAQAAFEQKDGVTYIYLTTMYTMTTHEGGYCEPTIKIYSVKDGGVQLICNTTTGLTDLYSPESYVKSLAAANDYLPEVVSKWNSALGQYSYEKLYEWLSAGRDSVPLIGLLSNDHPDAKMLAVNYFMRARSNPEMRFTTKSVYGYWETFTGDETRKTYQDVEHEVLTVPKGTTLAEDVDFILEHSSTRLVTASELEKLNLEELRIARNEIYARHGRKFKDKDLQDYFNSKSWYRGTIEPDKFNDNSLSEIEIKNRDLIQEYEKKIGG